MSDNTENMKESLKFTEDMKFLSNRTSMALVITAMVVLTVYCGFLSYNIWVNLTENNTCKSKPSATDATFTCPNQNATPNLTDSASKDKYTPYYLSDSGEKIPVTTFYGAINNFS
tara:strand:+ start:3429 stop:3773 length:345 start_codon:yes stop_codon:yes gene_type:complete